jgi:tRNA(adenine34) deaminase
MTYHEQFMRMAIGEAMRAYDEGEVPIGAVVVEGERVIGRGHNRTERLHDPTAHAEVMAITAAAAALRSWRLEGCRLYVTLEPCPMCAGAIVNARIAQLLFGAYDPKAGAAGTLYSITTDARLNHQTETLGGLLDAECSEPLRRFFAERRRKGSRVTGGEEG